MIKALLAYQEEDAKLRDIEKILSSSDERKKAVSAKKYLEGVEENISKLDARASELSLAFEKVTQKQEKLKEQQSEIKDSMDLVADENEIAFLIKKADELISQIKTLESNANKLFEEMQSILKEYSSIKKTTQVAQSQYKENLEKYNALKDSVKDQKESVEKALKGLQEKVDKSLMDRYLKKRSAKMYPILFELKGKTCGACGMELPMSEMNKLKNGEVVDCDNCGRMLYLADK